MLQNKMGTVNDILIYNRPIFDFCTMIFSLLISIAGFMQPF